MTAAPSGHEIPDWARMGSLRRAHVERVARLLATWAQAMGMEDSERARWLRAAWLHDALRDAQQSYLEEIAGNHAFLGRSVELLHGPAAAILARRDGEDDQGVLDAVHYHSVGYAGWEGVGRMLYLADYLEPGRRRRRRERAALALRVPRDPDGVLREVARRRVANVVKSGWPLAPETVAFWNALV